MPLDNTTRKAADQNHLWVTWLRFPHEARQQSQCRCNSAAQTWLCAGQRPPAKGATPSMPCSTCACVCSPRRDFFGKLTVIEKLPCTSKVTLLEALPGSNSTSLSLYDIGVLLAFPIKHPLEEHRRACEVQQLLTLRGPFGRRKATPGRKFHFRNRDTPLCSVG